MTALTAAVANTAWILQTPRLARHPVGDWLTGYVATIPDGTGDHHQWWVETPDRVVAASHEDDWGTALAAVADADAALITLARVGPR